MVTAIGKRKSASCVTAAFRGSAKYRSIHSCFKLPLHSFSQAVFLIKNFNIL